MNFIVNTGLFCIIEVWQEYDISYFVSQIFRNLDIKVQDDTKQIEEANVTRHMAKRKRKLHPLF
ncbi:hypothetical protein IMSAGC009_01972 [Lachnospiraceae bacterium]|nr:hypothetical protein IMSAGC009_01972 [Lachnospiraceae bacterium]